MSETPSWPHGWSVARRSAKGCSVAVRKGGVEGERALLLIHGGGGHSAWWVHVAPRLGERFRVLVPDLSGHGDSDHRTGYSPEVWADELAEIAESEGYGRLTVVGHSMGGRVGVVLAARWPQLVEHLILVDTIIVPLGARSRIPGRPRLPGRVFDRREAAVRAFRLRPPETTATPELLAFVAEASVTKVENGWSWKFDPDAGQQFTDESTNESLADVQCPVSLIHGELSSLDASQVIPHLQRTLRASVADIEIVGAYHHVPLDRPVLCAEAIANLVGGHPSARKPGR